MKPSRDFANTSIRCPKEWIADADAKAKQRGLDRSDILREWLKRGREATDAAPVQANHSPPIEAEDPAVLLLARRIADILLKDESKKSAPSLPEPKRKVGRQ